MSLEENKIIRNEHKIISDDFSDKLKELEIEQRKRKEIENELCEYKQIKSKFALENENFESTIMDIKNHLNEENAKQGNQILHNISDVDCIFKDHKISNDIVDNQQSFYDIKTYNNQMQNKVEELTHEIEFLKNKLEILNENNSKCREDYNMQIDKNESRFRISNSNNNSNIVLNDFNENYLHNTNTSIEEQKIEDKENNQIMNLNQKVMAQMTEIIKLKNELYQVDQSREDLINKLHKFHKERNSKDQDLSEYTIEISSLK